MHRSIRAFNPWLTMILIGLPFLLLAPTAVAQVSGLITYQGKLFDNGSPLNDTADITLTLWDQPTGPFTQIGPGCTFNNVSITDGLVTVSCDFGADAFKTDENRYLEISVRTPAGAGSFVTLSPRQQVTPTPFAMQAKGLEFPYDDDDEQVNDILVDLQNTAASGTSIAIRGQADSPDGVGIKGEALAATGIARGVEGISDADNGFGVIGTATHASGTTAGVAGYADSEFGTGVYGEATSGTGLTEGVWGVSHSTTGAGVRGDATSAVGVNIGGEFYSASTTGGIGVYGEATADDSNSTRGVAGISRGDYFASGVYGRATNTAGNQTFGGRFFNDTEVFGYGVYGEATWAGDVDSFGVEGVTKSRSSNAAGVSGVANSPIGDPTGVFGESLGGYGVWGYHTGAGGNRQIGVYGLTEGSAGSGVVGEAVQNFGNTVGVTGLSSSSIGTGVLGDATKTTGRTTGGNFISRGDVDGSIGVRAEVTSETGSVTGLFAQFPSTNTNALSLAGEFWGPVLIDASSHANQPSALEVRGDQQNSGDLNVIGILYAGAGSVAGNLNVSGTLTKGSGTFKIDHPLDPENKYLSHSFVESPDMMNIYNGNVITDEHGYATIELPEWFEALNREFRYQLTVIDTTDSADFVLAKVVHEIEGNSFRIRSSAPDAHVSWQVTGVRQDPFAEHNRVQVETDKADTNHGRYLHPKAYGVDESLRIKEQDVR